MKIIILLSYKYTEQINMMKIGTQYLKYYSIKLSFFLLIVL